MKKKRVFFVGGAVVLFVIAAVVLVKLYQRWNFTIWPGAPAKM